MKFQSLFLLLLISLIFPSISFAQDTILNYPLSIKLKKVTVNEALSHISEKTNYYFTFDGETLNTKKIISVNFKNTSFKSCLDQIFNDPELCYKVIDNHIVINKKKFVTIQEKVINDSTIKNIELHGKVIDHANSKSLPYAAVSIENYNIGTITNAQGAFILKIPKKLINADLCVSFIGYLNTRVKVEELYAKHMVIKLQRNYISVQEVIIRSADPKTIIRQANNNIENNYCSKPNYLTVFYRESVKQKDRFMFFSEAVLKVYKASYTNLYDKDQLKVLKSRNFHNVSEKDTVRLRLKSGLSNSLALDFVKNRLNFDFINEENFYLYNYKMVNIVTYNDQPAYVIEFEQKPFVQDALYLGWIYVDIDKLAYIGAEFSINPNKINKVHNRLIVKKTRGLKLRVKHADYRVSYHVVNGKYYLRHVKGELSIRVKKRRKLFATTFVTSLEMAVCSADTIQVKKFKRKESDKLNTVFAEDKRGYDNYFWEEYNFIKPDDNWQEAVKKLQIKLENKTETSLN